MMSLEATVRPKPVKTARYNRLPVAVYENNRAMGLAAALDARDAIAQAIAGHGQARVILATGNSQLTFLGALRELPGIDWSRVDLFHMDEYVGIDPGHPASFPGFLRRHIVDQVRPRAFAPVPGQAEDLDAACRAYEELLRQGPIDLCALGIGENGHLAFNDPPLADFDDPVWVKVVQLDAACRNQQVGEGHFGSLEEVPKRAITLTIPALLAARRVLAIVPEARKAAIVYRTLHEAVGSACPATILRETPHAGLYLDTDSAAIALPG